MSTGWDGTGRTDRQAQAGQPEGRPGVNATDCAKAKRTDTASYDKDTGCCYSVRAARWHPRVASLEARLFCWLRPCCDAVLRVDLAADAGRLPAAAWKHDEMGQDEALR